MTTQATSPLVKTHLPVCTPCAEAFREGAAGGMKMFCPCDAVAEDHCHMQPSVTVDIAGRMVTCPACVCCSTNCIPDAVLCAEIRFADPDVIVISSYDFAELEDPEEA